MSNLLRYSIPVIALLSGIALPCPAARGTVVVIERDTGSLLEGVRITVSRDEKSWQVRSGRNGEAPFEALPPGPYRVNAQGSADIQGTDKAPAWQIADGQENRYLVVLFRPNAMTGRVVDENAQPLPGMIVVLEQVEEGDPEGQVAQRGTVLTDDRGMYRFGGLAPGTYALGAMQPGESSDTQEHAAAYYPSERELDRARRIKISGGVELTDLNIACPTSASGGLRVQIDGIPSEWESRRAVVALQPRAGPRLPVATQATDTGNEAHFPAIPTGEYDVIAWGPYTGGDTTTPPDTNQARYGTGTASIRNGETSQASIRLGRGVTVDARIKITGTEVAQCPGSDSLELSAERDWQASWTFRPVLLDGERARWQNVPAGRHRIEVPALDSGCEYRGMSRDDAQMSVHLAAARGSISGQVRGASLVALWPALGKFSGTGRLVSTDAEGKFEFSGLRSGIYCIRVLGGANSEPLRTLEVKSPGEVRIVFFTQLRSQQQ